MTNQGPLIRVQRRGRSGLDGCMTFESVQDLDFIEYIGYYVWYSN